MATPTKIWILIAAFCSAAGWILSARGQLNGTGYLFCFVIVSTIFFVWRRAVLSGSRWPNPPTVRLRWHRLRCRFRRPLPMVFLLLALLALIGGALYAPNNYVIVGSYGLAQNHRQTIEQWVSQHGDDVIGRAILAVKVARGRQDWYVVKLGPQSP